MNRKIVLFDTDEIHGNLLPLSYTRPVADFRIGIRTLREVWEELLPGQYSYRPMPFMIDKFGTCDTRDNDLLFIAGNLLPDESLLKELEDLPLNAGLEAGGQVVAWRGSEDGLNNCRVEDCRHLESGKIIKYVFDVFLQNGDILKKDFRRLTAGRQSAPISPDNNIIGGLKDENGNQMIFIEEGANVEGATLNVKDGPIYIGKNAVIMEGACVRGPLALGNNSQIKMGAKIYGATTFGPYCKIGGEVQNVVIFGFTNKAHDGYLGNAVIGEWCNIGAGVNASNLKNDYSKIRIWNYRQHSFMRTDLQFCGLIMGDHSKAGINCMFNTATVVGVGVNIHGSGFPRVFIPSFLEGSPQSRMTDVPLNKFYQIAERVLSRRGLTLTESDFKIYEKVYEVASSYKA